MVLPSLPPRYSNLSQSYVGSFLVLLKNKIREKRPNTKRLKLVDTVPFYFVDKDPLTGRRHAKLIPFEKI